MISSRCYRFIDPFIKPKFQSRNRGSFDFKFYDSIAGVSKWLWFQSRNRGSFDFKKTTRHVATKSLLAFQSRNRGSFDFKLHFRLVVRVRLIGFNLVIEVLLISSRMHAEREASRMEEGFNLVIEVLLISSCVPHLHAGGGLVFQSRNRGSFDFKRVLPHIKCLFV